jgi:hypothetical protein
MRRRDLLRRCFAVILERRSQGDRERPMIGPASQTIACRRRRVRRSAHRHQHAHKPDRELRIGPLRQSVSCNALGISVSAQVRQRAQHRGTRTRRSRINRERLLECDDRPIGATKLALTDADLHPGLGVTASQITRALRKEEGLLEPTLAQRNQ